MRRFTFILAMMLIMSLQACGGSANHHRAFLPQGLTPRPLESVNLRSLHPPSLIFVSSHHVVSSGKLSLVSSGRPFLASIDTMKLSKDQAPSGFSTSDGNAVDVASGIPGLSHITDNAPLEYPATLVGWANRIHADGKSVWFRMSSFGTDSTTPRGDSANFAAPYDGYPNFGPGMLTNIHNMMIANPSIFHAGDVIDGEPETENSSWWATHYGCGVQNTSCTPCPPLATITAANVPCEPVSEFNSYLQAMTTQLNNDITAIGLTPCSATVLVGCVLTTVHSTDAGTAVNQLSTATVNAMDGLVTVDDYPDAGTLDPTTAANAWTSDLNNIYSTWQARVPSARILLGEFGYNNNTDVSDSVQQSVLSAETTQAFENRPLAGANYWVGPGWNGAGGYTYLMTAVNGVWSKRLGATAVGSYFTTENPPHNPIVGQVLTTTNGIWAGSPTSFAYQWQRCSPTCVNIAGATSSSYTVQAADVADTLDVIVTATNSAGSTAQISAATGAVLTTQPSFGLSSLTGTTGNGGAGINSKVASAATPSTSGRVTSLSAYLASTATTGTALVRGVVYADSSVASPATGVATTPGALLATTDEISLTNSGTGFPAAWYTLTLPTSINLTPGTPYWIGLITGGTANVTQTYSIASSSSTDTNANTYTSGPANPFGTASTVASTMAVYGTQADIGSPVNSGGANLPAVSGTTTAGSILTVTSGTWSGSPTFAYRWQDCDTAGINCHDIGGATCGSGASCAYTLVSGDVGKTVRAIVTATNSTGSESAASAVTAVIAAGSGNVTVNSAPTGPPTPTGGWTVEYADGFGATLGTGSGQDNTLFPEDGPTGTSGTSCTSFNCTPDCSINAHGLSADELEVFGCAQTHVQADGVHMDCTYEPNNVTGQGWTRHYLCGAFNSRNYPPLGYKFFYWNPSGSSTWAVESVVQFPPNTGEADPAWWSPPDADTEIDFFEGFGYGAGFGGVNGDNQRADWCLRPATTTNGAQTFPRSSFAVTSTNGFPASGSFSVAGVTGTVSYTSITNGTTFGGVTGGTGTATDERTVALTTGTRTNIATALAVAIGSSNGEADLCHNATAGAFNQAAAFHTYDYYQTAGHVQEAWVDGRRVTFDSPSGATSVTGTITSKTGPVPGGPGYDGLAANYSMRDFQNCPSTPTCTDPYFNSGTRTFIIRSVAIYEATSDNNANTYWALGNGTHGTGQVVAPGTVIGP